MQTCELPLAAVSLPAVSKVGFYFYLNPQLSTRARPWIRWWCSWSSCHLLQCGKLPLKQHVAGSMCITIAGIVFSERGGCFAPNGHAILCDDTDPEADPF